MVEEVFDVALQSTGAFPPNYRDWQESPPPEDDFPLSADMWIGALPYGLESELVFDACGPAAHNFRPARQYGCRYAFCRKVDPPSDQIYTWDHDGFLGRTLFLSRLIRPTTVALKYSARLFYRDGQLVRIVPGPVNVLGAHVWIVATDWRDWLTEAEAEQLRQHMTTYILKAPERVRRARTHIDHTFHAFYFDQRTASLVSAFESLLKTERHGATAQFKLRAPTLAQMVGLSISPEEAEALYDERSTFVHGRLPDYTELSNELMDRYGRFEEVLRRALLKASTDVEFCKVFETDEAVALRFRSSN